MQWSLFQQETAVKEEMQSWSQCWEKETQSSFLKGTSISYINPSTTTQALGTSQRNWEEWASRRMGKSWVLSSVTSNQELIAAVVTSTRESQSKSQPWWVKKRQAPPLTEELLGEEKSFSFEGAPTSRFPMLHWMAPHPCVYGQPRGEGIGWL